MKRIGFFIAVCLIMLTGCNESESINRTAVYVEISEALAGNLFIILLLPLYMLVLYGKTNGGGKGEPPRSIG